MTSGDRREEVRHKIWVVARIIANEATLWAVVTGISVRGIRILSNEAIPPGTEITIYLMLQKAITLRGTIRWAIDAFSDGQRLHVMGVGGLGIVYGKDEGDILIHVAGAPDFDSITFPENSEFMKEIFTRIESHEGRRS